MKKFRYNNLEIDNFLVLENCIIDLVENTMIDNEWNINNITPLNFRYCLNQVGRYITKPNYESIYRIVPNINNELNIESIYNIYNIYSNLCYKYSMVISITEFMEFSSLPKTSIYDLDKKPGSLRSNFLEKIRTDNETTLVNKMQDKSTNPMKIIPVLNHYHNWSTQEKAKERIIQETSLDSLPIFDNDKLCGN